MIELTKNGNNITYNNINYTIDSLEDAGDGVRLTLKNDTEFFTIRLLNNSTKVNNVTGNLNDLLA